MDMDRDSATPLDLAAEFSRAPAPDARGSIALSVERRVADRPHDGPERRARLSAPAPLVERERAIVDLDEPREPSVDR